MLWPGDQISVAVHLSPVQFRSRRLLAAVKGALATSGLSPHRLELEVTEEVLLPNSERTQATLYELRSQGVRISLHDFGKNYSSLSYLCGFPFEKIKIDRSFIAELTKSVGAAAIVRAIAGLGRSLNLSTTAQGVETDEQFRMLRAEGCTEVQGYLFSPPVEAEQIPALLGQIPVGLAGG